MSPLPNYTFLPWLRQGVANNITAADMDAAVKVRASVQVDLSLDATKTDGGTQNEVISRPVSLYGPGDIVGIESRAVVRTEPRNWITNFEPNYLAAIEFYDEDFPWRYTPAAPNGNRLRPWIVLVVLKEDEFTDGKNIQGKPLSYISIPNTNVFPDASQLWAWGHVHVNRSLTASDTEIIAADTNAALTRFQSTLNENPDLAYSRLICPRKLEENTAYHAFVLPVYESGRLAGLGVDPAATPHATFSAWAEYPAGSRAEPTNYPVYYRWYFRTGSKGDFEYLVRLLEPKTVNPRVGIREMDVQRPGANLPGITDPDLEGVLRLGGALRVPEINLNPQQLAEAAKYENWNEPGPHPFQEKLAAFINLADDYAGLAAGDANSASALGPDVENDPDPLITAPLYGRWHALTQRLLEDRAGNPVPGNIADNWVHEMNLDPRWRVTAGFGTGVVQQNQESYMDAAWGQIGEVLEANKRIRWAQFARETGSIWYTRHLQPMQAAQLDRTFLLTAPMHRRVMSGPATVFHQVNTSVLPTALTSQPLRRVLRPGGRPMKHTVFSGAAQPGNLLTRVSSGEIDAVPPKVTPPGLPTVESIADRLEPTDVPPIGKDIIRRFRNWRMILIIIAVVLVLLMFTIILIPLCLIGLAGLFFLWRQLEEWEKRLQPADSLKGDSQTPESVDQMPKNPDFTISRPEENKRPIPGSTDSAEAVRFKTALKEVNTILTASAAVAVEPVRQRLNLPTLTGQIITAINPDLTVPKRTLGTITLPPWIVAGLFEVFQEAMAYPELDIPMYKPLVDISSELFLPNIQLIEQNSITLLETNQRFIEAYMVGLNHEFARELLWREYPTDQRGSYFRQFWDVSSYMNDDPNLTEEQLREKLRDIPEMHLWSRFSQLGDHDHREVGGESEEEVVLVIRGELLKKYPTAVIYAQRADWQRTNGQIDNKQERVLVELSPSQEANPPRTILKTPLYKAQVAPDIYFFGFDLTAAEAKGGTGENPADDPGWFFVIKERPGEPRFGLDIDKQPQLNIWNDLSWEDVLPGAPGGHIAINQNFTLIEPTSADVQEKEEQWEDDKAVTWNTNTNAAELAYILYQVPVLVAVHAAEMLRVRP
jgi:hypothetical protein